MVTETDQVAAALDEAAQHWPAQRHARRQLLLLLIEEGYRALQEQHEHMAATRQQAVVTTSGALTGVYGQDYLAQLRQDWPA